MYCDNKSAIALCCNNVQHSRSTDNRPSDFTYQEHVEKWSDQLKLSIRSINWRKDIFTKAHAEKELKFLSHKLESRSYTDGDNDSVFRPKSDQSKLKVTKINFVKSDENVKSVNKENTHNQVEYPRKSQSPRENGRKPVLNNKGRVTGQREIRLVWNNGQRVNRQNKFTHPHPKRNFVPTAVVTKLGQVPVNTAKQSSPRTATSISTAMLVNIAAPKPKVNDALPTTYSYFKAHSPVKMAFNQKSAAKTNKFNEKVNNARVNNVTTAGPKAVVSVAKGNGKNAVKSSACWI
ncbi:hypothetical protein Tco_0699542 [Tanacetum coccineum]